MMVFNPTMHHSWEINIQLLSELQIVKIKKLVDEYKIKILSYK